MEFYNSSLRSIQPDSPKEINDRLRRRYLDRLSQKVKRLRKLLIERNWEELRSECEHLASSGVNFGFQSVTHYAIAAQNSIPKGKVPRPSTPLYARETTEALIAAVDSILIEHTVSRA